LKICKKCEKELPIGEFYVHAAMKDGHLNFCKSCVRQRVTKHRGNNLERIQEYDRNRGMLPNRVQKRKEYIQTEHGKKIKNSISMKWTRNNPRKKSAEIKLNNYLRSHPEIKESCRVCGSKISQAHHENYDKPLEVVWLCPKHHKDRHREMEELNLIP
jgi:hypothetical protein